MADSEDQGRAFADLTALFEDAAATAPEGQNPGLARNRTREITHDLRRLLQKAEQVLGTLP